MNNKIVVVGAGYAGIIAAKKLAKRFRKNSDISITIIDRNPFHTMLTELHEVAAGRVDEDSIKIGLKKVFAGRKVRVVQDTIGSIEFDHKLLKGEKEDYSYDYLVLAAGSRPAFFRVSGAKEHAFKLWSYEDAIILKEQIHQMFRKAACETEIDKKRALLTFFVVGAGFTGVEMAGELAEYIPILCEKYETDRELVSLYNVDILKRTVPILPEKLSSKVEKRLKKMGVNLLLDTGVVGIGEDFIEIKSGDKVQKHSTNTVIWAAGIECAQITQTASQTLGAQKGYRIKTDSYLRAIENESVYVIGDNMYYIPKGEDQPVPQMVENCENSAAIAAHNIICAITGKGKMTEYKPEFHGVMVSVGGRYGVARVGVPKLMFNLPSFLAMFTKHFINIIYFIQVLGWNKVFSYLKHEFFTIRFCRSFVGGHFSNRTPSFLLVPLRIWLGCIWVFEGVHKIYEGWFTSPKLSGFFGGSNAWYDSILKGASKAAVTDGISAATTTASASLDSISSATSTAGGAAEAAQSAGTVIFNFDFLGLFRTIFVTGKDVVNSTVNDYAFKIDVPLMNWFTDNLILPNDSVQLFMQTFIVVAEILIGLALIGGLFTTPVSAFSLVLQAMFVATTGLYLSTIWMVFAAIAVLIGGGRIFGLDYYAMPFLKRLWKRIPIIRKSYLYHD